MVSSSTELLGGADCFRSWSCKAAGCPNWTNSLSSKNVSKTCSCVCVCAHACVRGHACACALVCLCKVLRSMVDAGQGRRLCLGQGRRIFSGVPKLQGMPSVAVTEAIVFWGAQARRSTELM